MRSLPSRKWWSRRAVHWKPLRGEVSFQIPLPVAWKSHGTSPIGVAIGVEPVQLEFRPPLAHQLDELRRQHRNDAAHGDVGAQHVARDEEERLVLADRAAQAPRELLAAVLGDAEVGRLLLEVVLRLQRVVRIVEPEAAVVVVAAALGDHVHQHRGVAAVLGVEVVHQHAHFLDALGVRVDVHHAAALAGTHRARVDHEVVRLAARAVGVHVHAELVVVDVGVGLGVRLAAARRAARDARRQHDEVEEVPPDERKVLDLVLPVQARHARLRGFDERSLGGDRDFFCAGRSHLEAHVDRARLRRLEPHLLALPGLEALDRYLHRVEPARQRGEPVVASRCRVAALGHTSCLVGDRHCCRGNHSTTRVRDDSLERACELGPSWRTGQCRQGHRKTDYDPLNQGHRSPPGPVQTWNKRGARRAFCHIKYTCVNENLRWIA